ncbi:MAG: acyl-CoA/acyl-ACP dehydrogenase [Nitrososphaerota archaeon]|jgi:alkylation response protein AidB-like acyl-CoA dehydrogenase|nr:acyl-CoA/acyl-ACP dehydrogenase [Nitrososphaerota archaeon]
MKSGLAETKQLSEQQRLIVESVEELCSKFDDRYWRELDSKGSYPEEFLKSIERLGLAALPVPEEYGGPSLGLREAYLVLENINLNGGNSQPLHGQYYLLFNLTKFASPTLKEKYLTRLARGEMRLQSFALTEPDAGSDTTRISTSAKKKGGEYEINGHKIFISRVMQSDLMLIAARTTPYEEVNKKTEGISLFLVDLRDAISKGQIEAKQIRTIFNSQTYELYIRSLMIPEENMVGEEGRGFRYLLDVLNPERILISAECIGDAKWFVNKCVNYANSRVVFQRPIGVNQGVQFPIASVYSELVAAEALSWQAAGYYDEYSRKGRIDEKLMGAYANISKYLAAECSSKAANVAMDIFGGYSMTRDTDVARKMIENRLYRVAPISQNLVLGYLAHSVLGLPKSY